jgi:subtilisin-like proprotein convertase family protein
MMKRTSLAAATGLLALLAQSLSAQVLYTTTNDFTGAVSTLYSSDSSTVNGIGNQTNPGGTGVLGSKQVASANGWQGWLTGSDLPSPTSNVWAQIDPGGTRPWSAESGGGPGTFVANSGTITFDIYRGNLGDVNDSWGITFNYNGFWGPFWASSVTPFTGADGRTWARVVIPYTINATSNVTYFGWALASQSYSGSNTGQLFYVDNFAMYVAPPPPPPPNVVFTTTNDFTGWSTGSGFTNVAPTAAVSLDSGPSAETNGLGNLVAPGAAGTSGSLVLPWVSGAFSVATESPNLSGNAAVIDKVLHAQTISYDITIPTNNGGNYFQLGMTINCEGRFDYLSPSVTLITNNIYRCTIDMSTEAPALINQKALNGGGFSYFYIGFFYNSNYSPSGDVIYVDNVYAVDGAVTPNILASASLASESCSPTNGTLDPGETVTINVALQNMGIGDASNVVATLQATGGVLTPSGAQSYGTLLPGAAAVTNSFTFDVGGTCGGTLLATVVLQTNSTLLATNTFLYPVGTLGPVVTNTYSSGGISVGIPDNDLLGVTNSIAVTSTGFVSKVVVRVRMNHTYDGDVAMKLVHPDGTAVELIASDPGNTGQDFGTGAPDCTGTFTVFDQSASTPIAAGSAPYAGSYIPRESLATMNGKAVEGDWKLVVSDDAAGDVGTLYCWQLEIAYQSYDCCTGGGGGPADPFATWQFAYFGSTNSASSLPTADPDGDGMINSNEFLAGFNPTNNTATLRIISLVQTGQDVRVTYLGANGDGILSPGPKTNVLEFAAGASNGSYSNNFVSAGQTNILTGGSGVGVVTNMIDIGGATNQPSRYYRVRVLTP